MLSNAVLSVLLLLLIQCCSGLGYTPSNLAIRRAALQNQQQQQINQYRSVSNLHDRRRTSTQLAGWLDFKPFHGGGSLQKQQELDEQWEAQQAILRNRRGEGGPAKETLKKKYMAPPKEPEPAVAAAAAAVVKEEKKPAKEEVKKPAAAAKPFFAAMKMPWEKE